MKRKRSSCATQVIRRAISHGKIANCCVVQSNVSAQYGTQTINRQNMSTLLFAKFTAIIWTDRVVIGLFPIVIYKSIQLFAKRCHFEKENKLLLTDLMQAICAGFDDLKYAAVRHQALAAAHQILAKCKQFMDADVMQKIKAKVEHMAQNDKKPIVVQQAIKLRNDIF
eukprot:811557_1